MKKMIFTLILGSIITIVQAQQMDSKVLFTIDKEPVTVDEFLRVYNKNLDLVKDESQKDIDAYLKLFVDYKLKIKEAKRLNFDKKPSYLREFESYKKQLTQNFLSDNKVTEDLVKEAYERSTKDVKASHVLIRLDPENNDTTEVYNRLMNLRDRISSEGYETVQKEVHDGKNVFAEDLGYFSAFKMVYPFETMAYNTEIGEVSKPFRTQFGYHIVHVQDKRPSLGQVTVAHIMVADRQQDSTLVPKVRINEIYKKLQQGEEFASLAKQFSDDKSSASRGGALSPFSGGQLSSQEFEDVAFSLETIGDVSEPFKTDFGWHIAKLLDKRGVPSFEEARPEIEQRIKRDSRSKLINSALVENIKKNYKIETNEKGLDYFETLIDESFFTNNWKRPQSVDSTKVILTIKDQDYNYADFLDHLTLAQKSYVSKSGSAENIISKVYNDYLDKNLLAYHEDHLEFENPEFGFVINEYREGLLLFDLMEQEVWNAASKDSVGLKEFYQENKEDYKWMTRVDGTMYSSPSKEILAKVENLLKNGKNTDEITVELNADGRQNVIVTNAIMEKGDPSLPENFKFQKGVSDIYSNNGSFHIFDIEKVIPEGEKSLEEARGRVVGDYQTQIEEKWIGELHDRYDVEINDKVLKEVKSKIKS